MFGWFKKDLEVERVVAKLSEQLAKVEDWRPYDGHNHIFVKHRFYNIITSKHSITSPDSVSIPFRWKGIIKKQITAVCRKAEVKKLHYVHDIIDGKYPYYIDSCNVSTEILDWLKENAPEDQYMHISGHGISTSRAGLYFIDAELAMAYKLVFEN